VFWKQEKPTNEILTQSGLEDSPVLELRDLVKVYETANGGFTALRGINLSFQPGEFVGVLGKSGAGKSTLVNMITATDTLTSGEVLLQGVSLHALAEEKAAFLRGKNLGIVYQGFRLMPTLTLVDNVRMPIDFCGDYTPQTSRERALELLDEVELSVHAFKPPSDISGGQQQRVAIARALANDPPIIVADEPTGRLDSATTETIVRIFEDLARRGKLVLMATHDMSLVERFSTRITLADGEITAYEKGVLK
jgi:putative ABC transport system ATP-binding protein